MLFQRYTHLLGICKHRSNGLLYIREMIEFDYIMQWIDDILAINIFSIVTAVVGAIGKPSLWQR